MAAPGLTPESSSILADPRPWAALRIAGLIEADQARRTRDAPRQKMSAGASLPRHVATEGWSVSLGDFLEHLDVQSLITNNLLETNVLLLERLKSLRFLALHTAVLAAPAAQRRYANHERLQHLADAVACGKHRVSVAKLLDDLLGAMSFSLLH